MKIKFKKGGILDNTHNNEEVDVVLISSDQGTPLCIILQHGDVVFVKSSDEDDFSKTLESLDFL